MHLTKVAALLTSISGASAGLVARAAASSTKPASASKTPTPTAAAATAAVDPWRPTLFNYTGVNIGLSFLNLFINATYNMHLQRKNWTIDNFSVLSIYATTGLNASGSFTQQDFTQMEIQFLATNTSRVTAINNFEDGGDFTGSSSNKTVGGLANWSIAEEYDLVSADAEVYRTWAAYDTSQWDTSLGKALNTLQARKLNRPWDQMEVTLPKYTPGSNTTLNNNTLWYEFSSNLNASQSFIVSENGRVFRRSAP